MRKAIITEYKGIKFRSRLEAEVAYVLDALGLEWDYEPKSFLLPGGYHYIPDFFVPALGLWVEARGYKKRDSENQLKAFALDLPKHEHIIRISPQNLGGCVIWAWGEWQSLLLVHNGNSFYFAASGRGPQLQMKAEKSRVKFLCRGVGAGASRWLKVDDALDQAFPDR